MPDVLQISDVAVCLGVSQSMARDLIREGHIIVGYTNAKDGVVGQVVLAPAALIRIGKVVSRKAGNAEFQEERAEDLVDKFSRASGTVRRVLRWADSFQFQKGSAENAARLNAVEDLQQAPIW